MKILTYRGNYVEGGRENIVPMGFGLLRALFFVFTIGGT